MGKKYFLRNTSRVKFLNKIFNSKDFDVITYPTVIIAKLFLSLLGRGGWGAERRQVDWNFSNQIYKIFSPPLHSLSKIFSSTGWWARLLFPVNLLMTKFELLSLCCQQFENNIRGISSWKNSDKIWEILSLVESHQNLFLN